MSTGNWKRFQDLVGRIERVAAPHGAVVTSPDRLPDVTTGALREVDASVRYRIGSVDILITVEARRRRDREDVTWVEQLASKRENVGANATVAVSSRGFSKEAQNLAARKGITLRTVMELDSPSLERLFAPVLHVRPKVEFLEWGAETHGDEPLTALSGELMAKLKDQGPEANIFLHRPTNSAASLMDLVRLHHQKRGLEMFDGVPAGGGKRTKSLEVVFPDPMTLTAVSEEGKDVSISRVYLGLRLWREDTLVPPDIAVQYGSPAEGAVIGHSEFQMGEGGNATRLMLQSEESRMRFAVDIINESGEREPGGLELIRRVGPTVQGSGEE